MKERSQMDVSYMLHEMCHNVLSAADIKAIGKSRGFSAKEIATPALLANFFLSPIGVQTALQSLSREEVAFLYFLKEHGQEIGIAPFSRIYGDASTGNRWPTRPSPRCSGKWRIGASCGIAKNDVASFTSRS